MKHIMVLMMLLTFTGCASVGYKQRSAIGITNAKTVYIVEHPATRSNFLDVMKDWLFERGYKVEILAPYSQTSEYDWALTYSGKWSWDLVIYLSDAEIRAYHNGILAGKVEFDVAGKSWNINPVKYGSAEKRIKEMLNRLFE